MRTPLFTENYLVHNFFVHFDVSKSKFKVVVFEYIPLCYKDGHFTNSETILKNYPLNNFQ